MMFEFSPTTLNLSPAGSFSPREHIVYATARFSRATGMARGNGDGVGSMVVYASMTSFRPGPPAQIKLAFRPSLTKPAISQYSALIEVTSLYCEAREIKQAANTASVNLLTCKLSPPASSMLNVMFAPLPIPRLVMYSIYAMSLLPGAALRIMHIAIATDNTPRVLLNFFFHKVSYLKIFYSLSAARQAQPGTA